jgi:hypothetical protein
MELEMLQTLLDILLVLLVTELFKEMVLLVQQ